MQKLIVKRSEQGKLFSLGLTLNNPDVPPYSGQLDGSPAGLRRHIWVVESQAHRKKFATRRIRAEYKKSSLTWCVC